jgi:hypothetical protein
LAVFCTSAALLFNVGAELFLQGTINGFSQIQETSSLWKALDLPFLHDPDLCRRAARTLLRRLLPSSVISAKTA